MECYIREDENTMENSKKFYTREQAINLLDSRLGMYSKAFLNSRRKYYKKLYDNVVKAFEKILEEPQITMVKFSKNFCILQTKIA